MAGFNVLMSDGGYAGLDSSTNQDFRSNSVNWVTIHKAFADSEIVGAPAKLRNFRDKTIEINEAIANAGIEGVGPITVGPNPSGIYKMEDRRERLDFFSGNVHKDILDLVDDPFHGEINDLKVSVFNNSEIVIPGEGNVGGLSPFECDQDKIRQWLEQAFGYEDPDATYDVEDEKVQAALKEIDQYDSATDTYGFEEALDNWDNLDDAHKEALRHLYEYYFRQYENGFSDDNDISDILSRMQDKLFWYDIESGLKITSAARGLSAMMAETSSHCAGLFDDLCNSESRLFSCDNGYGEQIPPEDLRLKLKQDRAGIRLSMDLGLKTDSSISGSEDIGYYTSDARSLKYIRVQEAKGVSYEHVRSLGFSDDILAKMLTGATNSADMEFLDKLTRNQGDYTKVFAADPGALSASCAETYALYLENLKYNYFANGSENCRQEATKINIYMMENVDENSSGYFNLYNYGLKCLQSDQGEKDKTLLKAIEEGVIAVGRGVENELIMLPSAITDILVRIDQENVTMLSEAELNNINLEGYWDIVNKKYEEYLITRDSQSESYGQLLEESDLQYVRNLYYSYLAYVKKGYENLTLTQEMMDQLNDIEALIAKADYNYASKFHFDYEKEQIAIAEEEHPWAFAGGKIIGDAAIYMMLTPLGGSESVLAQKTVGEAAKVFAKNVMIGTAKDFLVKDGPVALAELAEGKDYIVVMQDTGKALLYDMAGNVLGEAVNVGIEYNQSLKAQNQWSESFNKLNTEVQAIELEKGTWDEPAIIRGNKIDKLKGNDFENGKGVGHNYPVIDDYQDGMATSFKSRDLRSATYQNPSKLEYTIKKDVDSLATFKGHVNEDVYITESMIDSRTLDIVVPNVDLTSEQINAINNAIDYAQGKGVRVVITVGMEGN